MGLVAALVLSQFLAHLLCAFRPTDLLTFAGVPVLLLPVALPGRCVLRVRPHRRAAA